MASSMYMISTAATAKQQLSKSPPSSLNHISSFIDRTNNGVTIKRRTLCGGNLSAIYGGSSRARQLRYFNGKSKSSRICYSLPTSDISATASAAYGVLLLGGGLFAYTRTGSKGSLIGGLTGGALMSTAYFLMQESGTKDIGDALAFGSALLFASVFGIRFAATRKVMPAAPLLGLSIAALAVFVSAYMQDRL